MSDVVSRANFLSGFIVMEPKPSQKMFHFVGTKRYSIMLFITYYVTMSK